MPSRGTRDYESTEVNVGCHIVPHFYMSVSQSSLLAYAAHCQADPEGRPLAGTMVICREPLNMERYTHEHYVQVTVSVFEKGK